MHALRTRSTGSSIQVVARRMICTMLVPAPAKPLRADHLHNRKPPRWLSGPAVHVPQTTFKPPDWRRATVAMLHLCVPASPSFVRSIDFEGQKQGHDERSQPEHGCKVVVPASQMHCSPITTLDPASDLMEGGEVPASERCDQLFRLSYWSGIGSFDRTDASVHMLTPIVICMRGSQANQQTCRSCRRCVVVGGSGCLQDAR